MFYTTEALLGFRDNPALLAANRSVSYGELAAAAGRFALRLPKSRGLIGIEMAPSAGTVAAYLGALQAGHAVMPLPADQPEVSRSLVERFRPIASWRRVGERFRLVHHDQPAALHAELKLLLTTSGSTGQGRGVRLSAQAIEANANAIAEYLQISQRDRAALVLPLHYSYGLSVLHSHLARGASIWLSDRSVLAPDFLSEMASSGATSLAGVPHHFRLLEGVLAKDDLPAGLTCMTVAGGAMPAPEVARWARVMTARQGRFIVMYGQTEATARIAYLPHEHAAQASDAIGRPIPGGSVLLRDEAGQPIDEDGREGELVYSGPNVMMGYADEAADLARGPELTELATGDLALRGPDGLYRITGRKSRMSKIAGLRIGHDALERGLSDEGADIAVWGDDEVISIAAAHPSEALRNRAAALAGIGAQHIAMVRCPELPRRPNGKIDYPALQAMAVPEPSHHDLRAAFARAFAPRPVRGSDSFENLGGDSLRHVELSLVLDRRLGGVPAGWEKLTIAELEKVSVAKGNAVPMSIVARALAILAVVLAHQTLLPFYGGAAAMVMLMGMSVAEHRRQSLISGQAMHFLAPAWRVLVPYGLVMAGYALAWQQVPWASLALIGNFGITVPETHLMMPYLYWFVEAYMQMCLLLLVIFYPRRMRDLLATSPLASGFLLLALGVLLRVTLPELWPMASGRSQFTVPWVFYLFALGWCIAVAKHRLQRVQVLLAAAVILPLAAWLGGNWYGSWTKYLGLLGLTGVLLFVPALPLPRPLARAVMHLAQAAFPIYLLHRLVPEVLMSGLAPALSPALFDAVAVLGGIALGTLGGRVMNRAMDLMLMLGAALRSPGKRRVAFP